MSPAPHSRRWFRPQISLRTLLLLMLLVGVGLTVYRWPWEEQSQHQIGKTGDIADYVRTAHYRRSWRGPPVKHGLEQVTRNKKMTLQAQYEEGLLQGPRRVYTNSGKLLWEAHYQAGELHGPFRAGDGKEWFWEGEYFRNEPHGEWRFRVARFDRSAPLPPDWRDLQTEGDLLAAFFSGLDGRRNKQQLAANPAVRIQTWKNGRREGVWRTETGDGEVLASEEFHSEVPEPVSTLGERDDRWVNAAQRKAISKRQP